MPQRALPSPNRTAQEVRHTCLTSHRRRDHSRCRGPHKHTEGAQPLPSAILGIGIDLIEVDRIKAAYERWGERFLSKVFTEEEARYCFRKKEPYPSLAARFAAREAGFKAFSQAGVHVLLWRSLYVTRDDYGRPTLILKENNRYRTHLAITHTRGMAMATVVVEAIDSRD